MAAVCRSSGARGYHGGHTSNSGDLLQDWCGGFAEQDEEAEGVFIGSFDLCSGLGLVELGADRTAAAASVSGPVSGERLQLTGGPCLSVPRRGGQRTASGGRP
jgi:hypothetical protein